jgi:poly(ADP-ribose) glycohydrolase ARH3
MDRQVRRDKFIGAFLGTAVGDALGAPFEGYPEVTKEEIEAAADGREVLTYTDDTHMMIGVAESLIRNRGFDGQDMAETFVRHYDLEPWRGYGPGPPRIFRMIRSGIAWDKAALKLYQGGSFGNGAAMRVAPIGALYHHDPEGLRQVACGSSQITHAHRLGKEGAALQACAVALATGLEPSHPLDRDDFLARLIGVVQAGIYQEKLDKVKTLLPQSDKDRVVRELGHGIEAFNSVPTAIYAFLSQHGFFVPAVLGAVSLGGDADTIGAMTGAISGAYLGAGAIPARWRAKLENRGYIEELAEQLSDL